LVQQKLRLAEELSSEINHCYQALLSPLSRVEYILNQNDMVMAESDGLDDLQLIEEIMAIREELDDANLDRVLEIEKENKCVPYNVATVYAVLMS